MGSAFLSIVIGLSHNYGMYLLMHTVNLRMLHDKSQGYAYRKA